MDGNPSSEPGLDCPERFLRDGDSLSPTVVPSLSETVRVLLVGRVTLFRRWLAGWLVTDHELQLVGSVGKADEGYRTPDQLLPDVTLIRTTLPAAPGLTAAT